MKEITLLGLREGGKATMVDRRAEEGSDGPTLIGLCVLTQVLVENLHNGIIVAESTH